MTARTRPRRPHKPPADKPQPPPLRYAEPERPAPGPGQTAIQLRPYQPSLWSL